VGDLTTAPPPPNPATYRIAPAAPKTVKVRDPLGAAWRLMGWGSVLARHDALIPREITPLLPAWARPIAGFVHLFAGREGREGRPGQRLGKAFEHLGPVAIKLGQVLATRADIFGGEFATDLGRLKDKLPAFPTDQARREVERSLGRSVESLYIDFGDPIGAASLAQAHPAWLADGRKVAVKVLRPGVERRVIRGLDAMRLGARIVHRLVPVARRLEPDAFVETIARSMELELDMRLEAAAASEMKDIMEKATAEGGGHMTAPGVVWDGVGKRVLTLEWAKGIPMTDPLAAEQPGLDKNALADNVVRAFLVQALDYGTFHADLHEGNLFASAPAELMAVDFGIVGRLGPGERRYLAEILWGFLNRDYPRIARVHFEAGYVPPHHSVEAFAQALRAVGEPVIGRAASQVSMGRLLGQLFEITALFDMHLRPELILLQKTMVSVEGVARRLNPDHDLWAAAQPVVERWILRELGPRAQVRDGVRELISGARALSRLVQDPPRPETVVVQAPGTPAWLVICVSVATSASVAALVLSIWSLITR
jgi:ubiquinone biosynthesis protein